MTHSQRKPRGGAEVVIFGRRAVREALEHDGAEVVGVRIGKNVPSGARKAIEQACRSGEVASEVVEMREVTEWSREPKHDQGVAARIRLLHVTSAEEYAASLHGKAAKAPARVVVLDGITNPQNVGMIVRSCAAFGMSAMVWPSEGVPWIEGLVVKASAGTVLGMTIATCRSAAEGVVALQARGFTVVALDAGAKQTIDGFELPHRLALVLGSETEGVSAATRGVIDGSVRIEMERGVESLNVAASAAVASYAFTRVR